jgi:hypothetical protein
MLWIEWEARIYTYGRVKEGHTSRVLQNINSTRVTLIWDQIRLVRGPLRHAAHK